MKITTNDIKEIFKSLQTASGPVVGFSFGRVTYNWDDPKVEIVIDEIRNLLNFKIKELVLQNG